MQFTIKRDLLLKSLSFVQGIVEKKYATNTIERIIKYSRQKIKNCSY